MAVLASLLQMFGAQGLLNVIFPHQLSIPPLNLDSECLYECFRSYFAECLFSELSFQVLVSGFKNTTRPKKCSLLIALGVG